MVEKQNIKNQKSPVGAAILSAICPGLGLFYIGNMMKAVAYIIIFACLIILQIKGRGHENVVFGLLIAGFYVFQIFDTAREARKTAYSGVAESVEEDFVDSYFPGAVILAIGVVFQLAELDIIRYRDVTRLWPVVLIAMGAKFIFDYSRDGKDENESEHGHTHEHTHGHEHEGGNNE
ncbi:MAG: hypothetical protein GY940_46470 [bacterium]|nr:hypothetical protein [bacterium]